MCLKTRGITCTQYFTRRDWKMKIVIVDDDPLVVSALTTIVENSDYEVAAEGTSGFDAVKLYSEHSPDLLMTDIRMREKSGLEASREILAADSEAKILLITTFKDDEYIHEALNRSEKRSI